MKETNAMMDYKCPDPEYPAEQPHNPGGHCDKLPEPWCPKLDEPDPCPPDPYHKCLPPPGGDKKTRRCLEDLIENQTAPITAGDKAKIFKADLTQFLDKANTAVKDYTREKYDALVKQWVEEDCDIAELVRKLVCALPCWFCVIERHVCPLLYDVRDAELRLFDGGPPFKEVHNLFELLFCQTQEKAAKERQFNRIKAVLTAWEKPATIIEKALTDNAKLIVDLGKVLGNEPSKVVVDLFFRLIPLHLAIAPPRGSRWKTKIAKEYTQFCHCDMGEPDYCCGPDVGKLSLRQRLIGPQPYLIDPDDYFDLICCLVEQRYGPAKDQLSSAEAAVTKTENLIKRNRDAIDNGLKNFDKDAKAAIPAMVDCWKYEHNPDEPDTEYRHA